MKEKLSLKGKLSLLCIAVVVVALCVSFHLWRNKVVADFINLNTITRVEISAPYKYVNLTKKEDIKEFADILDSIKLKRKLLEYDGAGVEGGVNLTIYIYCDNNRNKMDVIPERLWIDGRWYKCDMSYCSDIDEFFRNKVKKNNDNVDE